MSAPRYPSTSLRPQGYKTAPTEAGFAPPYQKVRPHPFVIANVLMSGSYISGQSALAYYGLIPEYVAATTSDPPPGTRRWAALSFAL
ncbi:MAG: hypothetical protein HC853_18220 [Anaerolineae bacterium]|nr:hypothetical protein [Anaerolineae bacterium]